MFRRAHRGKPSPSTCAACGAENSPGARTCRKCGRVLERPGRPISPLEAAPPKPEEVPKTAHKFCLHGTPFPPPGNRVQPHEVWCALLSKPVLADEPGPEECFCPAFTWRPTEAL